MTVQFKAQWQQYEANGVYTLSPTEETRLIGLGIAVAYTPTFSERSPVVERSSSTGQPSRLIDPATGLPVGGGSSGAAALKGLVGLSSTGFMTSQHILPISAWSAGTYRRGQVVKNTVNGIDYMWGALCPTGGGISSTAAPTDITATKTLADPGDAATGTDTAGWVFLGPVRQNATLAAEVVSYTSSASVPSGLAGFSAGQAGTPLAKIPLGLMDPGSRILNVGNILYPDAGQKSASNTTGGFSGITFWTDEADIGWRLSDTSGYQDCPVFVDGVMLHPGAAVLGNLAYRRLTFRNRRMRKIRITTAANPITNFYCSSTNAEFFPAYDDLSRAWLAVGDSYFGGAGPGPFDTASTWPIRIGQELGLPAPFNSAIGGSGAVSTNGGTIYNYLQRLTADAATHAAKGYRFAVLQGSGNDIGVGTLADFITQWQNILTLVRSWIPSGPIFVTSICNGDFVTIGAAATYNAAITTAIANVGDSGVYLIPMSSDTITGVPVLNPTNNSQYIGATDKHPWDSGHNLLARYVADQIRRFVAAA